MSVWDVVRIADILGFCIIGKDETRDMLKRELIKANPEKGSDFVATEKGLKLIADVDELVERTKE